MTLSDHDGKSQSASAVDVEHYPNPAEQAPAAFSVTHEEIAARAYELWLKDGKRPGSAERNWLEAERQLKSALNSQSVDHALVDQVYHRSGSVQP